MQVSVVIPSYNARATIEDCLRSILAAPEPPTREIIVVDSSDDGTGDRVRERFPDVRLVRLERRTPAGIARNLGAHEARGEVLAFTDADCIVEPDWLAKAWELHGGAARGPRASAGAIGNGTPYSAVGTAEWLLVFSGAFPGLPRRPVLFGATANLVLPRHVFLSTPGFDGSPTGQDMTFGAMLWRHGIPIRFEPSLAVRHWNRTRFTQFLRRERSLAAGSARARRRVALPGRWTARVPVFAPFLGPYRFFRIAGRAARAGRGTFLRFLALLPLVTIGLAAWTVGYLEGSLTRRAEPTVLPSSPSSAPVDRNERTAASGHR